MQPEQIPGSLFVLIMTALGLALNEPAAVFFLAIGCAFGWQFYNSNPQIAQIGQIGGLFFWAFGTILLGIRIFF